MPAKLDVPDFVSGYWWIMLFLIALYFLFVAVLSFYGLHRSTMLIAAKRYFNSKEEVKPLTELPLLCVQIPLFNESQVARRVIDAVMSLDYPPDKLEVQVLDDSDDETSDIVAEAVRFYATKGRTIYHFQRSHRSGYKAGALSDGLQKTNAAYVAIFDADFVPPKEFLTELLPYLVQDTHCAFVQARWSHLNRNESLLTRAEALLIDGHFVIEHTARHRTALFNFNGTAGIWRKEAIIDAGGWQGDTITEDLDLSYRAFLKGWRACYVPSVVCPAELPADSTAFKSQQYRWMKGAAQVSRKLLPSIMSSKVLSLREKVEAFFHLTAHLCYVCMVCASILLVPVAYVRSQVYLSVSLWFEAFVFFATCGSLIVFYTYSQRLQGLRCRPLDMLVAIWVGIGISFHCAKASCAGLLHYHGEFVRTEKSGGQKIRRVSESFLRRAWSKHAGELFLSLYLLIGLFYLARIGLLLTIPFEVLLLSGYSFIVWSEFPSLKQNVS